MSKRILLGAMAVAGLAAGAGANAAEQGFYGGLGISAAMLEVDNVNFDGDDTGFKLYGGYNFNKYISAEVDYYDAGTISDNIGVVGVDVEITGFNISAMGRLPLNETFALFGKLGFSNFEIDVNGADDDDSGVSYGVGGLASFGPFEIRGEYEMVDIDDLIDDADFSMFTVSGAYRF